MRGAIVNACHRRGQINMNAVIIFRRDISVDVRIIVSRPQIVENATNSDHRSCLGYVKSSVSLILNHLQRSDMQESWFFEVQDSITRSIKTSGYIKYA